ncbi:hypothetical protein EZL74_08635 [Flavobacterium silvisoli]|uniref:AlgX/AlgJ SGNH hydrolase-like domain-containing protein n=1 Tax=Flavobacterium silvisoli TaxID=2529433 RepID=A0A4Q9YX27_9FLAO|nr:hypothetical protein [Flavobacterium silvisoli]TBX68367.1 hypothetical protein EZL74_08635 [Flavobacterium silvisoli]
MKRFLHKIALFLVLPILLWGIAEALLPVTAFTHRNSEAICFVTKIPHAASYYPHIDSKMQAVGDLCHHTPYQVYKEEVWKTDEWGFRNEHFAFDPDIVIVGDSFMQGTSLSQDQTLAAKLGAVFDGKVTIYNMSPSSMSEFDRYLTMGILQKPKLLIFSMVERNVPEPIVLFRPEQHSTLKNAIKTMLGFGNLNVYLDKAFKQYSIKWLQSRINHVKGQGIPAADGSNMFFLNGIKDGHRPGDLMQEADVLLSYKKYCEQRGIRFMFLPMPNKETVYFEKVPFVKQPEYLLTLDSVLKARNVAALNTIQLYNEYRQTQSRYLYHLDDTHWNSNATGLVAKVLHRYITDGQLLKK